MKNILALSFCICATLFPNSTQAQDQSNPVASGMRAPHVFDQYGDIPFSAEKARLDNLAIQLEHEPNFIAYLIFYAGRKECVGEVQARAIRAKNYLVNHRGIKEDRVIWRDGGQREKAAVELWLWPRNFSEPFPLPISLKSEVRTIKNCRKHTPRKRGHRLRPRTAYSNINDDTKS